MKHGQMCQYMARFFMTDIMLLEKLPFVCWGGIRDSTMSSVSNGHNFCWDKILTYITINPKFPSLNTTKHSRNHHHRARRDDFFRMSRFDPHLVGSVAQETSMCLSYQTQGTSIQLQFMEFCTGLQDLPGKKNDGDGLLMVWPANSGHITSMKLTASSHLKITPWKRRFL